MNGLIQAFAEFLKDMISSEHGVALAVIDGLLFSSDFSIFARLQLKNFVKTPKSCATFATKTHVRNEAEPRERTHRAGMLAVSLFPETDRCFFLELQPSESRL